MTIRDLDNAAVELSNSINSIMATYGLSPTIMYYVMQEAVAAVSGLRVQEYRLSAVFPEMPTEKPTEPPTEPQERRHSMPISKLTESVERKIREKIENGETDADGKAHVSLREVLHDSESNN